MNRGVYLIIALFLFGNFLFAKEYTIGVIPKTMYKEYWGQIEAGAKKAASDLKVNIIYRGPNYGEDVNVQIKIAENFIERGVDAIVLAPADKEKFIPIVKKAVDKGIKVVIIDSDMEGKLYSCYVGSDNYKAGVKAGNEILKRVKDKNSILLLRLKKGNGSTDEREQGFIDAVKAGKGVIKYSEYGGVTLGEVSRKAETILRNNSVSGIFMSNGILTEGTVTALKKIGKKEIVSIGFDDSEDTKKAIADGYIYGTMVQNPFKIGYVGVKSAVDILKGIKVDKRIVIETDFVQKIK